MNGYTWELYDTNQDWTQSKNLAAAKPDKLREMQELFTLQATKYNVFPLDNTRLERFISTKPSYTPGRSEFTDTAPIADIPFPGSAPRACW